MGIAALGVLVDGVRGRIAARGQLGAYERLQRLPALLRRELHRQRDDDLLRGPGVLGLLGHLHAVEQSGRVPPLGGRALGQQRARLHDALTTAEPL